jgi:GTP 3',8-cyclase / cyclic pyranopterin monophosphate synthase
MQSNPIFLFSDSHFFKYCMPAEGVDLTPSEQILSSSEIFKLSKLFVENGVDKIRITGGEPLVRKDAVEIIGKINQLRELGLKTIAMTTNGISLKRKLGILMDAGLNNLNISLDTLDPLKFQLITRRAGHQHVIDAIREAASSQAFNSIKVNCVVMRNVNDDEILNFVELTKEMDIEIRFIE